jgi:hypothetical protein
VPHLLTLAGDELFDALDELVPVAVGHDSDLLQVLVVHLRQDVDGDLMTGCQKYYFVVTDDSTK